MFLFRHNHITGSGGKIFRVLFCIVTIAMLYFSRGWYLHRLQLAAWGNSPFILLFSPRRLRHARPGAGATPTGGVRMTPQWCAATGSNATTVVVFVENGTEAPLALLSLSLDGRALPTLPPERRKKGALKIYTAGNPDRGDARRLAHDGRRSACGRSRLRRAPPRMARTARRP